ncbi:maleylpyruvate isomerase family mycothiol-dependent enzyme [Streptomyces sp. NBC_01497]|uniref:maleylpyruvate isomerase family mycothiol-dependent enzyme n=1 Tax=Streptomyces sp. NBC_01497 TaxID=2903885 RepID=UPI002E37E12C|nr:maleylpyruvate isomerase family mycothiol-dependent enzyme [Streptomyces sp. NBC_01497]
MTSAAHSPRELSERDGFSDGAESIHRVLVRRRRALVDRLRDVPAAYWQAQSRCSEWTMHQVVRHVRDVARIHVTRLNGDSFPFAAPTRFFDPKTSPGTWLSESEGESPEETVAQLEEITGEEDRLFAARVSAHSDVVATGPLGRKLHWSVNGLHTLWDSWMHERDIFLPLGLDVETSDDELRLMVMYTLLAAAAPSARSGAYVEVTLGLTGSPDGAYRITHAEDDVLVRTAGTPEISGPVGPVLDSFVGRGPELGDVLGSSAPAVRQLGILRAVAT